MTVHATAFASQSTFRAAMECMARPGSIRLVDGVAAPAPLAPATAALVQALVDYETPVWLDSRLAATRSVADWIRFQTGAAVTKEPREAAFALVADPLIMPDFDAFALGTSEYPDRATTIVMQIDRFEGPALTLRGPGVRTTCRMAATTLPAGFVARHAANRALFPRGVDIYLVAGKEILGLPRSVHIMAEG